MSGQVSQLSTIKSEKNPAQVGRVRWYLYLRYQVDGFTLVLINDLCVNLRCAYVDVTKEFGDRVEVCSISESQGCKGMPEIMDSRLMASSIREIKTCILTNGCKYLM